MDNEVKTMLEDLGKVLNLINENEEYKYLKKKALKEYNFIKAMDKVSNAYEQLKSIR